MVVALRIVLQPREGNGLPVGPLEIEADRDRVAGTDEIPPDAERLAQGPVQPAGQDHEARLEHSAIREVDARAQRIGLDPLRDRRQDADGG
ncbi:hypothetical protein [Methylobacterium gregans]|uniref:hypothetical protein n=1 Tax=Methylobacterium gregans TaxID=374424 RepID=UPI00278EA66D|nr:hypothetical protein [Methylobacterium gregans]MDQ0522799.1 hypothetical protein [Methylobacterium gregans]